MVKKAKKAPSRKRYEERNPVVAIRITAEEKTRIGAEAAAAKQSVGEHLRQRAGLSGTTPTQDPPGGGVKEDLRRIQIREIVRASLRTLSRPEFAGCENVVDYNTAVEQFRHVESQAMVLPLKALEEALPDALAIAARAIGLPALYEEIADVEEELRGLNLGRSDLESDIEQLQGRKAALEAERDRLDASVRSLEGRLRKTEASAGMTQSEILQCLWDFSRTRTVRNWMANERDLLTAACRQVQTDLRQLRENLERKKADLQRLEGIERETFNGLANRLTSSDLCLLAEAIVLKETWLMQGRIVQGIAAYNAFPTVPAEAYSLPAEKRSPSGNPRESRPVIPAIKAAPVWAVARALTTRTGEAPPGDASPTPEEPAEAEASLEATPSEPKRPALPQRGATDGPKDRGGSKEARSTSLRRRSRGPIARSARDVTASIPRGNKRRNGSLVKGKAGDAARRRGRSLGRH